MINSIKIGQYYPARSPIHKMDPRIKIISVFIYIFALFVAKDYFSYLVVTVFSLAVVVLSRIPFKTMLKGLKPILIFILLTSFLHLFLTEGTEIWRWKFLKITIEGRDNAVFMTLRLILLIGIASLLTYTTTPIALTDGLERLLNPFKKIGVPAHELAMMMTIALRFIPTLLEETDKIMKAQVSRGASFRTGGMMKRAHMVITLLVPLFLSAFRRAEELALAMEARGYQGGEGRTRMRVLKVSSVDVFALLIVITFLGYMGYYRWF
ncbi:MAG: energy-coupling factor transporter transmembrane protein EcfT [Clostridia bacterium]|nr:energy-coupling factor transporter transmembrane protein EcfT [Clostridia bacterium]